MGTERAKKQLDRDMNFVRSLRSDTERMIAILEGAVARFHLKTAEYSKTHS